MSNKNVTVAIDGPVGAGKSCIAQLVAERLNAIYLDTGAMYRAMGLYMLRIGVDPKDAEKVALHASEAVIDVEYRDGMQHVLLGGEDVSDAIRENQVSAAASGVSAVGSVRRMLVERQREIARSRSVVMDGRDIGTHVLPDATLKVYLTATPEERAQRRYDQLRLKGSDIPYEQVLAELMARDHADMTRKESPLCKAEDAVELDSTHLSIEQVVQRILDLLSEKEAQ